MPSINNNSEGDLISREGDLSFNETLPRIPTVAQKLSNYQGESVIDQHKHQHPAYPEMIFSIVKSIIQAGGSVTYATVLAGIYGFFGVGRAEGQQHLSPTERELLGADYGFSSSSANWPMAVGFYNDFIKHVTTVGSKGKIHGASVVLGFGFALLSVFSSLKISYDSLDYAYFNEDETLKRSLVAFFALSILSTGSVSITNAIKDVINSIRHFVNSHREKYKHHYNLLRDFEVTAIKIAELIESGKLKYDFAFDNQLGESQTEQFASWYGDTLIGNHIQSSRPTKESAFYALRWYIAPLAMTTLTVTTFVPMWIKMTEDGLNSLGKIDWFHNHFASIFGDAKNWGTDSPNFTAAAAFSRIMMYTYTPVKFFGVMLDYLKQSTVSPISIVANLLLVAVMYGSGSGIGEEVAKMLTLTNTSNTTNATNITNNNPYVNFGPVANDVFFSNPVFRVLYTALIYPWAVQCATIITGNVINYRSTLLFIMATWAKQTQNGISFLRSMLLHMFNDKFKPLTPEALEVVAEIKSDAGVCREKTTEIYYLLNPEKLPAPVPKALSSVAATTVISVPPTMTDEESAKLFLAEVKRAEGKIAEALQEGAINDLPDATSLKEKRREWIGDDYQLGFMGAVGRCFRTTAANCCGALFARKTNMSELEQPCLDYDAAAAGSINNERYEGSEFSRSSSSLSL